MTFSKSVFILPHRPPQSKDVECFGGGGAVLAIGGANFSTLIYWPVNIRGKKARNILSRGHSNGFMVEVIGEETDFPLTFPLSWISAAKNLFQRA